ncbi:SDR family oxidoreductase [Microbacterium sp. A93]|uniref:SDR family oxidoreductase n=1 Tax=Microbacterium sp. A93 TaxID=3450716 RepID=UPI003F436926
MSSPLEPQSLFSLEGQVVVVTGGSRGLGRRIAFAAAYAGASVVIASRKWESCVATSEEIAAVVGRPTMPYALHVGHWEELEPFVAAVYERFGRVDVLVNNAGASPVYDKPTDISEKLFDAVYALNAKGPFRLTALVGERMQKAGSGSIINISSLASIRPSPRTLPYAAAKAALNATTVGFAQALGPAVRVNTVMPGTMETDIAGAWDRKVMDQIVQKFALKRTAQPDEVVGAVMYLASKASTYTTGATIRVDGGAP